MQNFWMQHVHSREAATGDQTYENFCLHGLVADLLLEQTFRPYQAHCWAHNLCLIVECSFRQTARSEHSKKMCASGSQDVQVVHVVFCCSQVRQVSKDDLME